MTAPLLYDLADAFPTRDHTFYGRSACWLGEDGNALAAGHGSRSLAALNALLRDENGPHPLRGEKYTIEARWATFAEECGCTEDEHTRHNIDPPEGMTEEEADAAGYVDCWERCELSGLPPCSDEYGWMVAWAKAPIVEVTLDGRATPSSAVPVTYLRRDA